MLSLWRPNLFYKMKYDLRGHNRSQKVILKFQNHLFLQYFFCINTKSFQSFSRTSTLWRHKFFTKWSKTLKVIQGHIGPLLCQNHSNTFIYRPFFMKICMNANIMKTQFLHHDFSLWPEIVLVKSLVKDVTKEISRRNLIKTR